MRTLIFIAVLFAFAAEGLYSPISSALAAARDARPATFSERFAPAYQTLGAGRFHAGVS